MDHVERVDRDVCAGSLGNIAKIDTHLFEDIFSNIAKADMDIFCGDYLKGMNKADINFSAGPLAGI